MSKKEQYQKILDKITIKFGVEFKNDNEIENALQVIEAVKVNSLTTTMFNVFPELLFVKSSKVYNIIEAVSKSKIPLSIIEKNPKIIEQTNKARIKKIENVLEKEGFKFSILENNPNILGVGKDKDIIDVIKVFEKNKVDKSYFYDAGDILAFGKPKEVEGIFKILEEKDLLNIVLKKHPEVFYENTADVVSDIIDIYEDKGLDFGLSILKRNPEILSKTTAVRIQAIINMLNREGVSTKVLKREPKAVYINETKDISEIVSELKRSGVDKKDFIKIPEVLTFSTLETNKLITKLNFFNSAKDYFGDIVATNLKIAYNSNIVNVREYLEYVEKGKIDSNIFKINPNVFEATDVETVLAVLENLEKINLKAYYIKNPNVLILRSPDNILKVNRIIENELKNQNFALDKIEDIKKEIITNNSEVFFEQTNKDIKEEIEDLVTLYKRSISKEYLSDNLNSDKMLHIEPKIETNKTEVKNLTEKSIDEDKTQKLEIGGSVIAMENNKDKAKEISKIDISEIENTNENNTSKKEDKSVKKLNLMDIKMDEEIKDFLKLIGYDVNESRYLSSMFTLSIDEVKANYYLIVEFGLLGAMKKGYMKSDSVDIDSLENEEELQSYIKKVKEESTEAEEISPKYITILTKIPTKALEKRLDFLKEKFGNILIEYNFSSKKKDEIISILEDLKLNDSSFADKYSSYNSYVSMEEKYFAQEMIESPYTKYLDDKIGEKSTLDSLDSSERSIYDDIMQEIDILSIKLNDATYFKSGYAYSAIKIKENLLTLLLNISLIMDVEDLSDRDKIYIKVLSVLGNKKMEETEAEQVCKSLIINEKESEINPEKFITIKNKRNEIFRIESAIKNRIFQKVEESKRKAEKEKRRLDEEARREAEEEEKKRLEEEAKRKAEEEEKKRLEEEAKRKAEEEKKRLEEEAKRKAEEEKRRLEEEARRKAEEEKKKLEEERKLAQIRRLEEIRRKEEEEARKLEESLDMSSIGIYEEESTEGTKIEIDPNTLKVSLDSNSNNNDSSNSNESNSYGISIDPKVRMNSTSKLTETTRLEDLDRVSRMKQYELQDKELETMKNKLDNMSRSLKTFTSSIEERAFNEEYTKAQLEKERLSKIIQRRQEKELEILKKQNEELMAQRKVEEEKALQEKIRQEAEKIAQEKLSNMNIQTAEQKTISVDDMIQSKESEPKQQTNNIPEAEDSLDNFYNSNNANNSNNFNNLNNSVDTQQFNTSNVQNSGNNVNNRVSDTKAQIMDEFKRNDYNKNNDNMNSQNNMNNMNNMNNNGFANSSNSINTPEFNRTIEAYYNPNQKAFFSIEDYGYILNEVDDEAQKRMQSEMNEIFKREKNNKYYD